MEEINPIEEIINKDEEEIILKELGKIEGLQEYLRAVLARDMRMHFAAQNPKEQDMIKGAYFRTEWLKKKIANYSVDNNK
jgi:hypothetical protein